MNIYSGYMRMYVEYLYVPASHAIFSIATIFALLTSPSTAHSAAPSAAPSSTPSASPSSTPSLLPFYSLFCPLFHSLGIIQVS